MGIVYRSPSNSKTMLFPPGETSSEIHVPSSVEKEIVRPLFKERGEGASGF
jgi:hypothetical protein